METPPLAPDAPAAANIAATPVPSFTPFASDSEDVAWNAGVALAKPPEDFDTPLATGQTPRQLATEAYKTWYEHRTAKGLAVFPTAQAKFEQKQQGEFRKAYQGIDKLKDNLGEDQFKMLDAAATGEDDPAEFQAKAINAAYFKARLGRDVPPESHAAVREAFAKDFNITGEVTDTAVYNAISNRFRETDAADTETRNVARLAFESIITGSQDDKNARDMLISQLPPRLQNAAREQYNAATHEAHTIRRRNKPLVDEIKGIVATAMAKDAEDGYKPIDTKEAAVWAQLDTLAEKLPDHPGERTVVLAMLQAEWQKLPKAEMDALGRFFVAMGRGVNTGTDAVADWSMTTKHSLMQKGADMVAGKTQAKDGLDKTAAAWASGQPLEGGKYSEGNMEHYDKRRVMRDMVLGVPADLSRASDGLLAQSFIAAAPSAWMLPASLVPGGMGIVAASMAGDSAMKSRAEQPGTDEGLRAAAAFGSGAGQAMIETGLNLTGMKFFKARVPSLFTLFNKAGVSTRLGRGIAGAVVVGGGIGVGEYTEEAAQGGLDLALQGLASQLSGINPKIDFGKYFGDWMTAAGPEQRETIKAILPYVLIGGGGAGVNHFKAGHTFLQNRTMLRGLGLTEAEARPVLAAETPDAAQAAFQAGFESAAERAATLTPEENARQEQHRRDAIETLRAQNEALAGAGLARVEKEHNDFTGEDQFIFVHPEDGSRKVFETEEAALSAFGDWSRAIEETNIETVQAAAHEEFLAHLTGEGMAGENVNAEVSTKTLTLPKVQAELEGNVKTAEKDAQLATTAVQRRAAQTRMEEAATSLAWLKERMKVMLFDMGLTPAQAGEAFKSTVILGRVFAQKAADRVLGYTVQLFHGHQVQDIAEEFSEANMREAFDSGFADPEILLDNIRRYEAATGAKVIDPGYQYEAANPVPLLEGFSKLARGYMMSEVRSGAMPENLRKWIEMQTALTAATVDIAKGFSGAMGTDIQTAKELREAIAAGYLPARLQQQLADAVGLDPRAQEARLQKKMEDQLAAEAMEGFPEIAETLQGQLPHPETLRSNSHPLFGEVRRIWDALKKPTRRKTKQGKAVDRTNEANSFFLPVGQMEDLDDVRARANERGFAFDAITDMLDALDASISYGKPFYGTGNGTDQGAASYSMTAAELDEKLFDKIGESALRVEQPKASYADKRQLLFDFAQSITGPVQQGTTAQGDRRFNTLRVIGQKFAEKLSVDLQCRFIGEEIRLASDLVIKAQALRNPLFETFYLLGMDSASGTLKGSMAVTSRVPCSANVFENNMGWDEGIQAHADFLNSVGADSYYILHNHPSGIAIPGEADKRMTFLHAKKMEDHGYKFLYHVVINHLTYGVVDRGGYVSQGTIPGNQEDPFAAKITNLGFPDKIYTTAEIAAAGARVNENKGHPDMLTGLVLDARYQLVAILQGKAEQFLALKQNEMQDFAREQGGTNLILYGTATSVAEAETKAKELVPLHEDMILLDAIFEASGQLYSAATGTALNGNLFKKVKDFTDNRFFGGEKHSVGTRVQEGETYSLSHGSVLRLEQAIANKMTQGPDERAAFYEKLRNRLAATILQLRESKRNLVLEPGEAERERNRIRDGLAEARAIIAALPAEARGKVTFPINDILDAQSERGQVNALIRLIQEADDALESVLLKEYREAFETLLDLAKPDLRQNKQVRGRLTPDTQRLVGEVLTAAVMTPETHSAALLQNEAAIAAMENQTPASPEAATEMQRQLIELYQQQTILTTFGAFSQLDAAQTAHAYQQLQSIYVRGRTARKILDEARRQEINEAKAEILATLPEVSQHQHAKRTADKGVADQYQAFRLGMSSFHQVIEFLFPKSTTARDMQERVRKADRGFTRSKIGARERFDAFSFAAWGITGMSRTRKRNAILAELSTQRETWGVQLLEGVATTTEKLTEDQAAAILAGKMKTGWETDLMAMNSLAQAVADFRMQRLKAQNEDRQFRSTVIRFQRVTRRGMPGPLLASDLQVVYFLQLYAQEQYRPALDKYGFTAEVMATLEKKLNPKAQDLADFLRDEYDAEFARLNPVYRAIYGLDMPRIRNYAPGLFEHLDSKGAADSTIDPYGNSGGVNAMSAGFTKARTHHLARPKLTNAMAGYWSHLEATEYFIHYAELCRDARQIFRNPELRRRIEGLHGVKAAQLFSQWLDALEVDGHFRAVEMGQLAEMTSKALATQSAVGLAFNVGVLFKQLPAAFGAVLEMPTKQAFVGMVRAIQNPGSLREVWNSEAVQQRVLMGIGPEDRRLLDAGRASPSMIMELLDLGRLPIAYADAAFTTLSGSLAYNYHLGEALKAGMGQTQAEASALAAAARVIERTAQPATTQDKSMGELTAKGFAKFLLLFKSDPRQKLAIVANAVTEAWQDKPGAKAVLGRKALWGWAIYGLCNEVLADIAQSMFRDDDDPDRWNWRDYLAAMIVGPVQGIPLLGSAFDYVVHGTVGTKAYSTTINPVEAGTTKLVSQVSKIWRQATDEKDEHLSINDILTKGNQVTAAMALAVGAFDPRAAIVPALLRAARDAQGALGNAWDAVTPESADDKALTIAKEFQKTEKTERDGKAEALAVMVKDLQKLPATERAAKLAKLDKETRGAVTRKLRAANMTPAEAALAKLPKDARAAAIEKITTGMEAPAKADYLDRLKSLGLTP